MAAILAHYKLDVAHVSSVSSVSVSGDAEMGNAQTLWAVHRFNSKQCVSTSLSEGSICSLQVRRHGREEGEGLQGGRRGARPGQVTSLSLT